MWRQRRCGFSLIELLVVVGTIGVLVGLILPAVQSVREGAARTACLNNLKQIGIGLHHFEETNGRLPPLPGGRAVDGDPNSLLGWMALILPQMEQEALYRVSVEACRVDQDPLDNPPHVGMATVIRPYVCPDDGRLLQPLTDSSGVRAAYTSYIGILGSFPPTTASVQAILPGVLGQDFGPRLTDITDGLGTTIMVGERPPPESLLAGWWYPGYVGVGTPRGLHGPNNVIALPSPHLGSDDNCGGNTTFGPGQLSNPCDRFHLWSLHPGGGNFLFADASARYLSYSAAPLMIALASRSGGEVVELP